MTVMSKKRNKQDLKAKRTIACALALKKKYTVKQSKLLGIGHKLLKRAYEAKLDERKKRTDAITDDKKEKIEEFFRRQDLSRSLPDSRSVKKGKDGELMSRKVMERSSISAHELFQEEYPDENISASKFASMRPCDVLPCTKNRKRDCLCEYCANIDLKLEAIGLFAANHRLVGMTFVDKYDLSRSTLCLKGELGEYKRSCLERTCIDCGTSAIEIKLRPMLETHIHQTVTYYKWETITIAEGGLNKRRMTRQKKRKPAVDFVTELVQESSTFSKHLFDTRQYDKVSKNVPDDNVVICQDSAENFKCYFQDEAQGAHCSYKQVTLHASVTSYRCTEEECEQITAEAMIFVSDDVKHDHHAVYHFNKLAMQHLRQKQNIPFKKAIYFSDGAPTQYKNKIAFADVSYAYDDFGVVAERHFFGTRHGKGPCDREFGTLKKAVDLRIRGRQADIDSAMDFFEFGQTHYTRPQQQVHSHYRRTLFYIPRGEIDRERGARIDQLKIMDKTRWQH